jgi:hypothetical protein
MTLSLHDRRVLSDIERGILHEDPGFAKRLAAFDHLLPPGAAPGNGGRGAPSGPVPHPPDDPPGTRQRPRARVPAGWAAMVALALVVAALIADAPVVLAAAACVTVVAVFLKVFGSHGFDERPGEHEEPGGRQR